jgi:glutamate dehydrogenase
MASTTEAKKAGLVRKAAALAGMLPDPVEQTTAKRVIAEFYEHVPPADVAERSARDLCGAALSLWRLAERRRPGQAKISVHNPDPVADGWSSRHTIVEIVNDDMPFLVDSVIGAINADNRIVHLVIHPVFTVTRGADGRLCEIRDAGASGRRESWMQIEITPESDRTNLARLTQTLAAVLTDVRAAVGDWQPMRQVLRQVVTELSARPLPPVSPVELAEVQDFLRWLDDDNFTFLGHREYAFDDAAKPEHEPLGILRDESHPVFGGLRDLSSLPSECRTLCVAASFSSSRNRTAERRFTAPRTWMRSGFAGSAKTVRSSAFTFS